MGSSKMTVKGSEKGNDKVTFSTDGTRNSTVRNARFSKAVFDSRSLRCEISEERYVEISQIVGVG